MATACFLLIGKWAVRLLMKLYCNQFLPHKKAACYWQTAFFILTPPYYFKNSISRYLGKVQAASATNSSNLSTW